MNDRIIKKLDVPTGEICICNADKGLLEFVSLHDYGKAKNIKAGFDVLVFIPSIEEDTSRITCGNAILSNLELLKECE